MNIAVVFGLVLVFCFLILFLREQSASFSWLAAVASCIVILLYTIMLFNDARSGLEEIFSLLSNTDSAVLLRITGIAILSQMAQEVCQDAQQRALAGRVELLGKIAILLAAAPLFFSFIKILSELLS